MIWTVSLIAVALFTGCADDDGDTAAACTEGDYQCTEADVLEECGADGWEVVQDCAADGMECHADMGHCM